MEFEEYAEHLFDVADDKPFDSAVVWDSTGGTKREPPEK